VRRSPYAIEAEPLVVRTCWCTDCQKFAAGSATVNVVFPAEAVMIEGTLSDYASVAGSGNIMHRGFCPTCGTPVTTGSEARPHLLAVRGGTLDNPELARPEITIWTKSAPSWAVFDPDIPQEETQPPLPGPQKA
jgi:hypothetical protein